MPNRKAVKDTWKIRKFAIYVSGVGNACALAGARIRLAGGTRRLGYRIDSKMERRRFILYVILTVSSVVSVFSQNIEVGKWRTHFASGRILDMICRGEEIIGAKQNALMCWDGTDNRLYNIDKTDGLSNTGISSVAYSEIHGVVLVGYEDGTVDWVYANDAYPLRDIKDKTMSGGKTINAIEPDGRYAYAATDFGIVVLDLRKEEIKETYFIGCNNEAVEVRKAVSDNSHIYALSSQGFQYAVKDAPDLNDFNAWNYAEDSTTDLINCVNAFGKIAVCSPTDISVGNAFSGWESWGGLPCLRISSMKGYEDALLVWGEDTASGKWKTFMFDAGGRVVWSDSSTGYTEIGSVLRQDANTLWIGTVDGRMLALDRESGMKGTYEEDGPVSDDCFSLAATGKAITSARGGYSGSFAPSATEFGASVFQNDTWTCYDKTDLTAHGISAAVRSAGQMLEDPNMSGHFFISSCERGIVEIWPDGQMKWHNPENSPLENNYVNHADCRIYGMDFDAEGNLWALNALAEQSLHVLDRNGNWTNSYDLRSLGLSVERINSLLIDYWQQKWVIFGNTSLGIFKTDGASLQGLIVDLNEGNDLSTSNVFCLEEDDLGHVWIGTDRGVKVIDQHARMFENPVGNKSSIHAKTVQVPKDGYLINLLATDQVKAIAVDGGNRKWLGTASNGLYLVSDDGMEEIHHFTAENSPLLSNNIIDLAIDDRSGEVFIATDKGIISYRGTATRTEGEPKEMARAFPNPVRPGYQGLINIKGLPQNAIVKITDTRGVLIYQGQATGGQLSWDGTGMQGKRPDSGVLFVYASGEDGSQALACKIFFIR